MLSIGEFSKICEVSTKTLRYYDEIGLIKPKEVDVESGYRYYGIEQLKVMLFINRLKQYHFSLEEIAEIISLEEQQDERLFSKLDEKKKLFEKQIQVSLKAINQLENDLTILKQGQSIMSYLENIDIELVEIPTMYLVFIRKMVKKAEFSDQYRDCFHALFDQIQDHALTIVAPPMVLFHSDEFNPFAFDTEFAIGVQQRATKTRDFHPGLCLKTTLKGSYTQLPSIYTKQCEWAENNGYQNNGPLYEVYVSDPSQVKSEDDIITEIYYPVKKQ